ncbi:unnamed protein product [Blumeria hordei]|uniref:Uncharacterized protein n=1 Tax=Blumeria hordei TaxID=2867405 RepID=A0A383UJ34_BLUHO|nr:unnamed protein product [Blumeria hordei]
MNSFDEVEFTSIEVDGPLKAIPLTKMVTVNGKAQGIRYRVVINKQNEVRGIIIQHNISKKIPVTRSFIRQSSRQHKSTPIKEKKIITLECPIDQKFPLLSNGQISDLPSPKRQKTL